MKPVSHIEIMLNKFLSHEKIKQASYGSRIYLHRSGQAKCLCLYEGDVAVYRKNGILFSHVSSPSIFGMNIFANFDHDLNLRCLSDCSYILVSLDSFIKIVSDNNLWEHLAYIAMYGGQRMMEINMHIVGEETKKIIYNILCEIYNLRHKNSNKIKVNASEYIIEKTGLSRSLVMKELKSLNDCGAIVIKRGVLEKMNDFKTN